MASNSLVEVLFIFALATFYCEADLSSYGLHVCSRLMTYHSNVASRLTRVGYSNYPKCCGDWWNWGCLRKCTGYRTRQVVYYQNYQVQRQRREYYCCPGWSRSGNQCPNANCNPGCINGNCVRPNVCQCKPGFEGRRCESDINECIKRPCSQLCTNLPGTYSCSCNRGFTKALPSRPKDGQCKDVNECKLNPCKCANNNPGCIAGCTNTVGSFKCSCNNGYKLQYNAKICSDIDECLGMSHGCQHNCINKPGSFFCSCKSGYSLDNNEKSCYDINECSTLNGGCNQICQNQIGSYKCNCKSGYRMSTNQKTCMDINECLEKKPCDRENGICRNILGSYRCSCKIGYRMLPDKKTCIDRNECENESSNGCQHLCHNNIGSYTCSCKNGFRLNENGRNCDDIDECLGKKDNCQHLCHNNLGSFSCTCKLGFKLDKDGYTCRALPCVQLTSLLSGKISCSGHVTNDHCNITCNEGYNLIGLSKRICRPSSTWSGVSNKCQAKICPIFEPPLHGSVLLPCFETFGSTCAKQCSNGYYMIGDAINTCKVLNGTTFWTPNNATCLEMKPCQPNPCLHNTKCTIIDSKTFSCDCRNTGYIGNKCEKFAAKVDQISQVIVGQKTSPVKFHATPDDHLVIHLKSYDTSVSFNPPYFSIVYPSTENEFSVIASKPGKYVINYEISGKDESLVVPPSPSVIYARLSKPVLKLVNVTSKYYDETCKTLRSRPKCRNGKSIKIETSCKYLAQDGYMNIITNLGTKFPIASTSISGRYMYENPDDIELSSKIDEYLLDKPVFSCSASCPGMRTSRDTINYLHEFGYYTRTIMSKFSAMLMQGVGLEIGNFASLTPNNLQISLEKGDNIKAECSAGRKFNRQKQYMIYKPNFPIYLQFLSAAIKLGDNNNPTCIAYDLCDDLLHLSFANGAVDILQHVENIMSDVHFDVFKVNGMSYDRTKSLDVQVSLRFQLGKLSMKLNGEMSVTSDSSPVNEVFVSSAPTIISYLGKLKTSTRFPILNGKQISLILNDEQGKIHCSFGKNSSKSGLKITSKGRIISSSTILQMKPNNKIQLYYDSNIHGGKIIGLKPDRIFTMWLQSFKSMDRMFNQFFASVKSENLQSMKIIQSHYKKANSMVNTLQKVLSVESPEYLVVLNHFFASKTSIYDLSTSLKAFLMEVPAVNKDVKSILRILNRFDTLYIAPLINSLTFKENGFKFSYNGKFCYHKLCFINVSTVVSSLTSADQIVIKVETKIQQKISSRLTMIPGQSFILTINKNENAISGTFEAIIRYYQNQEDKVRFKLTETTIEYEIGHFKLIPKLDFKLSGKRSLRTATWASVLYNLQGEANINNEEFWKISQNIFEQKSLTLLLRERLVKDQVEKANKKLRRRTDDLKRIEESYISAKLSFFKSKTSYDISVLQLKANQTTMGGYLKFQPKLVDLIERDVHSICSFESCEKTCLSIPICQVCQEEEKIPTTVMKCQQIEEKIRKARLEQVHSICHLKRYSFKIIYTGSCPNPSHHGQRQGALEASLITTGTAVGFLIGGPLGGILGWIVGFFVGLFTSCSKSYEVIQSSYTITSKCTKLRKVVKTTIRPYSVCLDEQINVKTGYSSPKQCKCSIKECVVKMESPTCIKENYECRRKRNAFLRASNNLPKIYTDLQNNIQILQNKVEENRLIFDRMKLEKMRIERKLNESKNLFEKAKQISTFSNKTKISLKILYTRKGLCQANVFRQYPNISNIAHLKKISFDVNIPILHHIELFFEVQSKLDNGIYKIPIVYGMDDFNITTIVDDFLNKFLCQNNKRKRRSLDEESVKDPLTSSIARHSCLKLKNALNLLNKTSQVIEQVTQNAIQRLAVRDSIVDMPTLSSDKTITNPILKAQNNLLQVYSEYIEDYQLKSNISNVVELAQEDLEILVSLQNQTNCFSAKDCINKAFEELQGLSSMVRPHSKNYRENLLQMKDKFMETIYEKNERNLLQISKIIKHFQKYLLFLSESTHHCSRPPKITSIFKPQINVQRSESIALVCKTTSDLPTQNFWYKDDELVDGEESNTLIINATSSSIAGGYKCFVSSKVGQAESNETLVFVYDLPRFIEEPKDFDYILPSDGQLPRFYCNATGNPDPTVQWFYHKTPANEGVRLNNENSSELIIENPQPNLSGFYSCMATNQFGMIKSTKGMLRVLTASLPSQILLIFVKNISKQTISKLTNYKNLEEYLAENKGQSINISININNYQVNLSVASNPQAISPVFSSRLEMLDSTSKMRRDLSSSAAKFVNFLTVEDVKELNYSSNLNNCEEGSEIHKNNFMCVPCMPGRAGKNCHFCLIGSYQPDSGRKTCIQCPGSKTTESEGARFIDQCISKDTAIVFVIDVSINTRLAPVKRFLKETFQKLTEIKTTSMNFKFALITYSDGVDILSAFNGDLQQFLDDLSKLTKGKYGWRFLHLGIKAAGQLLTILPPEIENRFIVVISNGRADGSYYYSGFSLARKASLDVQDQFNKTYVISVNRYKDIYDVRTLYGISSQPKVLNTVIGNTWSQTRSKFIERLFKQNEKHLVNLDIGLLFHGGSYQLHQNIEKSINFLVNLKSNLPKSKFSFLQSQRPSKSNIFKVYTASTFAAKLKRSVREIMLRSNQENRINLLQRILNDVMNEDHNSLSPKKILLTFSSNGISLKELNVLNRVYKKEKFFLINLLYDENTSLENMTNPQIVNNVWLFNFKYFQSQNVVNMLKELLEK